MLGLGFSRNGAGDTGMVLMCAVGLSEGRNHTPAVTTASLYLL